MKYYFRCPKCKNNEQFVKPSEESSELGCALLMFGGFIPALLYADHKRGRIQCASCRHIFRQPPVPSSPTAFFAGWILALTIIPFIIATSLFFLPDLAEILPSIPVMTSIETLITSQPRVTAYLLASLLVLIVIACWITACVSNARYRKQLATQYHLKPCGLPAPTQRDKTRPDSLNENQNA